MAAFDIVPPPLTASKVQQSLPRQLIAIDFPNGHVLEHFANVLLFYLPILIYGRVL
jgi:hypothetical protein